MSERTIPLSVAMRMNPRWHEDLVKNKVMMQAIGFINV
jgi:hypothetical protein